MCGKYVISLSFVAILTVTLPEGWTLAAQKEKREELPIGETVGQKLEYQSLKDQNLRIYRVRSKAMELKTEVNWKDADETFLKVNLPKCTNQRESCEWITAKIPAEKIKVGKTKFGYGVNGDQFVAEPDAFRRDGGQDDKKPVDLTSALEGTVADTEGKRLKIDVDVTSRVTMGKDKGMLLVYVIHVGNSMASSLALIKNNNPKKHPVSYFPHI